MSEIEKYRYELERLVKNQDFVTLAESLCKSVLKKDLHVFKNEILQEYLDNATGADEYGVYISDYATYNNCAIGGAWFYLSNYADSDEFFEHVHGYLALLDELYPIPYAKREEIMYQDWEDIPSIFISECSLDNQVFDYIEKVKWLDETRKEAFDLFIRNNCHIDNIDRLFEDFEEAYQGYFDGNAELKYAWQYAEECMEIPKHLEYCIDYDIIKDDLFSDGFYSLSGHVFRNL